MAHGGGFIVASQDRGRGRIYWRDAGQRKPRDITGCLIDLQFSVNGGAKKTIANAAITIETDQVNRRGEFTFSCLTTDIDVGGTVELDVKVTFPDGKVKYSRSSWVPAEEHL